MKERATGLSLNATSVKKSIAKTDIKLSFAGTPGIFKPGLPFEAVVGSSYLDLFIVIQVFVFPLYFYSFLMLYLGYSRTVPSLNCLQG